MCFSEKGSINGNYYVGGICGQNDNSVVDSCYNRSTVSSVGKSASNLGHTGGIAGGNLNNSTVSNCYNLASVTASYPNVGGIVGYNGNADAGTQIVKNVFNAGTIKMSTTAASANIGTSTAYVGYLIGRYGSLSGKYGNTTKTAIAGWDQTTITTNIGNAFVKNNDTSINEGLPLLNWQ